jgi:hypothetical protein
VYMPRAHLVRQGLLDGMFELRSKGWPRVPQGTLGEMVLKSGHTGQTGLTNSGFIWRL